MAKQACAQYSIVFVCFTSATVSTSTMTTTTAASSGMLMVNMY